MASPTGRQSPVFVRDATGLVKQFSSLDILLIASALVFSLQAASVQFPWYAGFDPGADLRIALLIAAIPFVLLMLVYWAAGVVMPRSGSDYVWVGRLFGPQIGFAWSAYYLLALFGSGYASSVVSVVYGLSSSMSIWGFLYNSPGMVSLATWLSAPMGTFVLSTSLTLLFALVALFGYREIKLLLYGGWGFAVVGIALMWYYLSVTTPTSFAASWDSILSNYTSYEGMFKVATQAGWSPAAVTFSASVASIPIAVLFLLGGNYVNAVSGEVKNVRYAVPISLLLSLVLGVIFWAVSSTLTLNATGYNWMSAVGYLFDNAPSAWNNALPYPPSMPLMLSLIAYPNAISILLVQLAFVFGAFPTLFFFYWIPSRYFFAWGFDRILPSRIANVNDRFRTPHWAILSITVISIVFLVLFSFTSWPSAFAVATLIWFSAFILPSIAVAAVPYLKKDAFKLAPAFMQKSLAGIPMITVIGILSAISFSWMTYVALLNPLLATITTIGAYATVGVIATALAIFYISVAYHKQRGIDIRLAFKEIPPE